MPKEDFYGEDVLSSSVEIYLSSNNFPVTLNLTFSSIKIYVFIYNGTVSVI